MAMFKFIGDPRKGHEDDGPGRTKFALSDIEFKRGEATEVKDERLAAKLRTNSHFVEVGASSAKPVPVPHVVPQPAPPVVPQSLGPETGAGFVTGAGQRKP